MWHMHEQTTKIKKRKKNLCRSHSGSKPFRVVDSFLTSASMSKYERKREGKSSKSEVERKSDGEERKRMRERKRDHCRARDGGGEIKTESKKRWREETEG